MNFKINADYTKTEVVKVMNSARWIWWNPPYFQLAVLWAIFCGPYNSRQSETIIISPFFSSLPFPNFVSLYFPFFLSILSWMLTMPGGIKDRENNIMPLAKLLKCWLNLNFLPRMWLGNRQWWFCSDLFFCGYLIIWTGGLHSSFPLKTCSHSAYTFVLLAELIS
jgi:hypothetical protein